DGIRDFHVTGVQTCALPILERAVELARAEAGEGAVPDLENLPDDPAVYQMLAEGRAEGVFQLETSMFRSLLPEVRPDRFEDLVRSEERRVGEEGECCGNMVL